MAMVTDGGLFFGSELMKSFHNLSRDAIIFASPTVKPPYFRLLGTDSSFELSFLLALSNETPLRVFSVGSVTFFPPSFLGLCGEDALLTLNGSLDDDGVEGGRLAEEGDAYRGDDGEGLLLSVAEWLLV
jgi:hypothetical protein